MAFGKPGIAPMAMQGPSAGFKPKAAASNPMAETQGDVRTAAASTPTAEEHRLIRKKLRAVGHPGVKVNDGPLTSQELAGVRQHMLDDKEGNELTPDELAQVRKSLASEQQETP